MLYELDHFSEEVLAAKREDDLKRAKILAAAKETEKEVKESKKSQH